MPHSISAEELAYQIADECARMDIESYGIRVAEAEYSLSRATEHEKKVLDRASVYLEMRGHLVRNTSDPDLVLFREQK